MMSQNVGARKGHFAQSVAAIVLLLLAICRNPSRKKNCSKTNG